MSEEDPAESAYWRFDARRNGLGKWKDMPMSERDSFKLEWFGADFLHARVFSLERLADALSDCNEIAEELGFDTTMDALVALRAMMRGGNA
jgi:hypothetical protein